MARVYSVHENPYNGLAESVITSKVINVQDAFDLAVSWYTTSGATSTVTHQISNAPGGPGVSIPEGSWSNWTRFGQTAPLPPSGASVYFPPLGVRYVRFLRKVASAASVSIDVNKRV